MMILIRLCMAGVIGVGFGFTLLAFNISYAQFMATTVWSVAGFVFLYLLVSFFVFIVPTRKTCPSCGQRLLNTDSPRALIHLYHVNLMKLLLSSYICTHCKVSYSIRLQKLGDFSKN